MEGLTLEECKNYLRRFLEICICQVCHAPLRPSDIAVCSKGHAVCVSCKRRVSCCAVCRSTFLPDKPTTLSQMVEVLPRFCRFNYGCSHILHDNDNHESWCEFRFLPCLYCGQGIECEQLLKHLSIAHSYKPHSMVETDLQKPNFHCNMGLNIGILKLFDNNMFNIHYLTSPSERTLLLYVSFYPTRNVEENAFTINLEICSLDKKVSLTFCQEVKLLPNIKSLVFSIPETVLNRFNGKNVLFRTTISGVEVIEVESESSTPVTINSSSPQHYSSSSYPTAAKRWKAGND